MTNRSTTTTRPVNPFRPGDPGETTSEVYQDCLAYDDRQVPWHLTGVPFKGGLALMDAARQANLFVRIVQGIPLAGMAVLDANGKPTPEVIATEQIENTTRNKAISILRAPHGGDPNWRVLGTSSDRYQLIQNETLCQLLTPLEKFGKLDTAGVLRNGALFFAAFHAGEWAARINGVDEKQEQYLIVKNSHLPGAALQFQIANVRVVCRNTWYLSDREATLNFSLAHTDNIETIVKWVVEALEKVPQRQIVAKQAMEQMASTQMDNADVKTYLRNVIVDPAPPQSMMQIKDGSLMGVPELVAVEAQVNTMTKNKDDNYRLQLERRNNLRNLAYTTYQTSETVLRGTAKGAFDALTEALGHGTRRGGINRQLKSTAESVMFGERKDWITRGFDLALTPGFGEEAN